MEKKTFFSGPSTADDIIFCSEFAKSVLENKIDGIFFKKVKNRQNTDYVDNIYQLYFDSVLSIEAIYGGSLTHCNTCGKKIIRIKYNSEQIKIKRKYLSGFNQAYRTGDILTEQKIGHTTFSVNIVPKLFYDLCEEYQLNHGMIYEPVKLI